MRSWLETVDELVREPVTRVIIRDPQSSVEDFVELAETSGCTASTTTSATPPGSTSPPKGCRRRPGWQTSRAELGVAQADVLAIGDGRNDVEMLAWAGRGVAMGQAPDAVKDAPTP